MKVSLICGSHQKDSNSLKLANLLAKQLTVETSIIDLYAENIPYWNTSVWEKGDEWNSQWKKIAQTLRQSDAFIILAPEYGGMVTPLLKNFFLLTTPQEVGHKPALAVGISSGIGGSYPISELRSSCYKNNKINFIPDHLIIRQVANLFQSNLGERETRIFERIQSTLDILLIYAKAFSHIREKPQVQSFPYPYGM